MKHKLLDWAEYELLRKNIAQYVNTLLRHEPEKDLTNDQINSINSYIYGYRNILNIVGIHTSKDSSNMFYRKINLVGKPIHSKLYSKLYLLDPDTMPKKNLIDSILSWIENGENREIYFENRYFASTIGLSEEDIKEYTIILDSSFIDAFYETIPTLAYGVHYTDYLSEM